MRFRRVTSWTIVGLLALCAPGGCSRSSPAAGRRSVQPTTTSTTTTDSSFLATIHPTSLAVAPNGFLFVADTQDNVVWERSPYNSFWLVVGNGHSGYSGDGGQAEDAELSAISDIAFSPDGQLFIADGSHVRVVDHDGIIHTIAGDAGPQAAVADGTPATSAYLSPPVHIAFSPSGMLYISTSTSLHGPPSQLLRLTSASTLATVRADVTSSPHAKGNLTDFGSMAVDDQGDIYVSSLFTGWDVYRIDPDGDATYLGNARRSGGTTAVVQRGAGGVIYVDAGSSLMEVRGDGLVPYFDFYKAPGIANFVFLSYFAFAPDGTVYADNLSGPFDPYQQIVSLRDGHASSLWQGPGPDRASSEPPTTSTTLLTRTGATEGNLVRHIWGTQSVLVPAGWIEHDTIPGGSSDTITFTDPISPANLVITINACALCGTSMSGPPYAPEPQNYLPKSGVTGTLPLSPYRLADTQTSATPGYETSGLVVDLYNGTTPNGTTTEAVTLSTGDHALATTILDSLTVP